MNIATLLSYHKEIQNTAGSVYARFNQSKIKEFYKNNGHLIEAADKRLDALHKKFFQMDKDGKIMTKEQKPSQSFFGKKTVKPATPLLKKGMTIEQYELEVRIIYEESCQINF